MKCSTSLILLQVQGLFSSCMYAYLSIDKLIAEYCLDQLEKRHFCEGNPPHSENALKLSSS